MNYASFTATKVSPTWGIVDEAIAYDQGTPQGGFSPAHACRH